MATTYTAIPGLLYKGAQVYAGSTAPPTPPPPPPPPPKPSPSASGSTIPPAASLIDAASNSWTVSGGVISLNGKALNTSQVSLLLYYSGTIYQNAAGPYWWSWNGSDWVMISGDPRPPKANNLTATTSSGKAVSISPTADQAISSVVIVTNPFHGTATVK